MIKKPDVLSNGKILEIWGNPNFTERDGRTIQRDADVKHYEPLIKEMYEAVKAYIGWLDKTPGYVSLNQLDALHRKAFAKAEGK